MNLLTFIVVPLFLLTGSASSSPLLQLFPVENASSGLQIKPSPRIVYGLHAVNGQFPWQVYMKSLTLLGNIGICGGSLISSRWVLTAAHCVKGAVLVAVALGSVDLTDSNSFTTILSSKFIAHESYSPLNNDIAVVYLNTPVTFSEFIQPIKISSHTLDSGVEVSVSGWGRTTDYSDQLSVYLKYVTLTTITNSECASTLGLVQLSQQIVCAKGDNIQSICNGDSGGPLITGSGDEAELVGVTSFVSAAGCANGNPSGYFRTAYYRDWIRIKTGI